MTTAREAAYLSLLSSLREEQFLSDYLSDWIARESPEPRDAALAYELATGTMRRLLTLEYLAVAASEHQKLDLKRKERILVFLALYQLFFLDRVPNYAVVDESVELAKKHCDKNFAKFLNALLRKHISNPPTIPTEYSVRYSYPPDLIDALIADYGKEKTLKILDTGNNPPVNMARKRPGFEYEAVEPSEVKNNPEYYIQNETPGKLMDALSKGMSIKPKRILDLCAAPGGKLLAAHDLFPEASLVANDISEARIHKLRENCEKFGIQAELHVGAGEDFPHTEPFDLIILDVPCSNTGVMNKRAEARWQKRDLEKLQLSLLENARRFLSPQGEIWYLTCSILKKENEGVTHHFAENIREEITVLPDDRADGGYGCALTHFSTR